MCLYLILAGASFVSILSFVMLFVAQLNGGGFRFGLAPDAAGAFAGGGTCGAVLVPGAIVAANPVGGLLGFGLALIFALGSGSWEAGRAADRAIAMTIGFGISGSAFIVLWALGADSLLQFAAEVMPTILGRFGVECE